MGASMAQQNPCKTVPGQMRLPHLSKAFLDFINLQRHFSMLTKFAHVASRLSGCL